MAGRKSAISLNDQKNVISKYKNNFISAVPTASNDVYESIRQELSEVHNKEMTKKAIYMCIKRNKKELFDLNSDCDDENIDCQGNDHAENEDTNSRLSLCFQMDIYEYNNITPRHHRLPKDSWTNYLQDQIWRKTDLKCTIAFKSNYVPTDMQANDIKCVGKCTQCGANISINISFISENFTTVTLELNDNKKDFVHDPTVKNRLTSSKVAKLKEKLKYEKALRVRHTIANEVMDIENPKEPPTLPKLSNLRKMRSEVKSALQFDKNTVLSVFAMAQSSPYNTFIRTFCLVPFFLYFWTNEQSRFYDEVIKNTYKILSIDATGSLFRKVTPPEANDHLKNIKAKHIFLYALIAYTISSSVPLCYMASESHTIDTIAAWLKTWVKNRVLPNEIICDDSSALIGAITNAFLNTDCNKYLIQCFALLEGQDTYVPKCYIRLDKSHFIKKLYKQSCFDKVSEKCKHFYINCIKQIQQLSCYKEVQLIITDIITISLHEYMRTDLIDTDSRCEQALQRLIPKIKRDHEYEYIEQSDEDSESDLIMQDTDIKNDATIIPLTTFYDETLETETLYLQFLEPTFNKNEYYLPEIHNTLKRLLKKLPMWGNVMNKYYDEAKHDATSSNVENHFKDIKRIYFNTKDERIRLDEFLVQHYSFINGTVKLSSSDYTHKLEASKNIKREQKRKFNDDFELESIFQDDPIEVENWRGLSVPRNKTKLKTSKPLYILQNGNIANSKQQSGIILTNTCAFDSVAQAFAVAYKDRATYRREVEASETMTNDVFTSLVKQLANTKKSGQRLYEKRENLLSKLFCSPEKSSSKYYTVGCECNVTKIFEDVCNLYFSATRKRCCTNGTCTSHENNNKYYCKYLPLNMNIIIQKGVKYLPESVQSCLTNDDDPICHICGIGRAIFSYDLRDVIIFELHDSYINKDDVPINIELNNKVYLILAIIEFEPPANPKGIGHYRAHCYRMNNKAFECYDDMYGKIQNGSNNMIPHAIIYTCE